MKIERNKPLPQLIIKKMSTAELTKFKQLENRYDASGEKMIEAQSDATIAMRNELKQWNNKNKNNAENNVVNHMFTKKVQNLINRGFICESVAFKASDDLRAFKHNMRSRYT